MPLVLPKLELLCSLCLATLALGASPAPTAAVPPVLGGPAVNEAADRTLVNQDMQGRFQRVEGRPEVAGLAQLALDPETRSKAADVINARTLALMKHLLDNIDLIREATDATRAGDNATAQKLSMELYQRFDPDSSRDPLVAPLAKVLPQAAAMELRRLVDEYWKAWLDVEMKSAPKATRQAVEQRLTYDLYQQELRLANEYTLRPIQQKLERIYEAADPTPEQRAAIRLAVIEYVKEARMKPTDEQRKKLARTIYDLLDEERRLKLVTAAISSY